MSLALHSLALHSANIEIISDISYPYYWGIATEASVFHSRIKSWACKCWRKILIDNRLRMLNVFIINSSYTHTHTHSDSERARIERQLEHFHNKFSAIKCEYNINNFVEVTKYVDWNVRTNDFVLFYSFKEFAHETHNGKEASLAVY